MARLLITAGPTREPIDAVRYISNRSSGRMGLALAEAGREAGWDVTLLLGPVSVSAPAGMTVHRFETTQDLQALLDAEFAKHDVLIMAAAVADYRAAISREAKLKRDGAGLTLHFEPTPDLLAACAARRRPDQLVIGFALEEPAKLLERATEKLRRKSVDAIVANPLVTMDGDNITATVIDRAGGVHSPGDMSKSEFAAWLIKWIAAQMI